jgi:hypothetical protein
MRIAPGSQYVPKPAAPGPVTIVVPGIPEAHETYELTPAGLLPLKHKRVTGGMQITIDDFQLSAIGSFLGAEQEGGHAFNRAI